MALSLLPRPKQRRQARTARTTKPIMLTVLPSCDRRAPVMLKNAKLQVLFVLAVGGLLGYFAATGKLSWLLAADDAKNRSTEQQHSSHRRSGLAQRHNND